jgi:hypothetical protein
MLALISRLVSTKTVSEDYEILSDSDKKAIASHLPQAMLQATAVEWRDINSATTTFKGGAALVCLHSGRRIHITGRSFWLDGEQVAAVSAIARVVDEANAKEAARLAVRQMETERSLQLAIQERRQRQAVGC